MERCYLHLWWYYWTWVWSPPPLNNVKKNADLVEDGTPYFITSSHRNALPNILWHYYYCCSQFAGFSGPRVYFQAVTWAFSPVKEANNSNQVNLMRRWRVKNICRKNISEDLEEGTKMCMRKYFPWMCAVMDLDWKDNLLIGSFAKDFSFFCWTRRRKILLIFFFDMWDY